MKKSAHKCNLKDIAPNLYFGGGSVCGARMMPLGASSSTGEHNPLGHLEETPQLRHGCRSPHHRAVKAAGPGKHPLSFLHLLNMRVSSKTVNFQDALAKKRETSSPRRSLLGQPRHRLSAQQGRVPSHPAPLLHKGLSYRTNLCGRKLHNLFLHKATSATTIHGFLSVSLAEKRSQRLMAITPKSFVSTSTRARGNLADLLGHLSSHTWLLHSYLLRLSSLSSCLGFSVV